MSQRNKKTPDKFLILSIIIGGFFLAGALTYAYFVSTGVVQTSKEQIRVPDVMTTCRNGQSCIVVETRCDFCCDFVAINAIFEKEYDEIFNRNCARYKGASCACHDLTRYPACIRGKCQLIRWPDAQESKP